MEFEVLVNHRYFQGTLVPSQNSVKNHIVVLTSRHFREKIHVSDAHSFLESNQIRDPLIPKVEVLSTGASFALPLSRRGTSSPSP